MGNTKAPNIRLLADRVLVKVDKKGEHKTAGGIIVPATASSEEAPQIGLILAVSPRVSKCEVEEDRVEVGETVIFSKYAGSEIELDRETYKVLRITDIFGAIPIGE
jgi:chaperonin GroES